MPCGPNHLLLSLTKGGVFPFVVLLAPFCNGICHSCDNSGHEAFGMLFYSFFLLLDGMKHDCNFDFFMFRENQGSACSSYEQQVP